MSTYINSSIYYRFRVGDAESPSEESSSEDDYNPTPEKVTPKKTPSKPETKSNMSPYVRSRMYFRFRVGDAESPCEESSSEDDYNPTPKKVTPKKTPSKPETKSNMSTYVRSRMYFRFRVGDAESPCEESSSEDDYNPTPKKVTPKKTPSKPETKSNMSPYVRSRMYFRFRVGDAKSPCEESSSEDDYNPTPKKVTPKKTPSKPETKSNMSPYVRSRMYFRFRVGDAESPCEESSSEDDYNPTPKKVTPKKTPSKPETKSS